MNIDQFDYVLPQKHIAYYPARQRDLSRLLVLCRTTGKITHHKFLDMPDFFSKGDGLVINDTRVFKARFYMRRKSGGKVEIFLLEPVDYNEKYCWNILSHPARRLKVGERLYFNKKYFLTVEEKVPGGRAVISFENKDAGDYIINKWGEIPLPVYIHRETERSDETRYQTIYADPDKDRSVAAPTAGLHFTNRAFKKLNKKGVEIIPVTLHVGYGTFKPVKVDNIEEHMVDEEYAEISEESAEKINRIRENGGKIFAVGSTSVRTLESAELIDGKIQPYHGYVNLYIRPGHEFRVIDHMITNFHLPKSSLMLMVAAFAEREKILETYNLAVKKKYRFYSYGDCMLIL